MKLFVVFVTLTVGYCLAAPERIGERIHKKSCTPKTTWKEECHSCYCTDDGKVACSKEACPPQLVPRNKRHIRRQACKEGESWKEDCRTCFCTWGKAACIKLLCPSQAVYTVALPEDDHPQINTETECTEGQEWKEDCHTCHCSKGKKVCTQELCKNESNPMEDSIESEDYQGENQDADSTESLEEEEPCPPNVTEWEEDCNKCHCDNGTKVCSRALCTDQGPVVAIKT